MPSLTPELHAAIVASVANGCSVRKAVTANGFSNEQVDVWLRISRGETTYRNGYKFSQAQIRAVTALTEDIARARAQCYKVLTSSLYHNATTLNSKTGWYDTQAADKLLSKSPEHREEWYENRRLEVTRVEPFHELEQARAMSDDELRAAYEQQSLPSGNV